MCMSRYLAVALLAAACGAPEPEPQAPAPPPEPSEAAQPPAPAAAPAPVAPTPESAAAEPTALGAAAVALADPVVEPVNQVKPVKSGKAPARAVEQPPSKEAVAVPAAAPQPPKPIAGSYAIASGSKASFLIDAPLEKIKGRWSKTGGTLTIDPGDLGKTRGDVTIDLLTLKTYTFGDPGKDRRQGEHALNWMEVGSEVGAATRAKHRTARFTIERIVSARPAQAGATSRISASGKLLLHGRTVSKTAELEVSFEGPAHAPTGVTIRTVKPLRVSLRAHDIKPRDLAGRFLAGALDKVGQKIADRVAVSLRLTASRK